MTICFRGVEVDVDEDKDVKKLLGIDLQLYNPGKDGEETEKGRRRSTLSKIQLVVGSMPGKPC